MQLPGPVRAVVGLVATAADEARHLPDRALELPMLAVSTALQASVRAQQRYARLTARGDALLNRRPPTDEPPAWATFDDPPPADEVQHRRRSAFDAVDGSPDNPADAATAAAQLLGDAVGRLEPGRERAPHKTEPRTPPAKRSAERASAASAQPAAKKPAKKPAAKKAGGAAAKKSTTKKPTAKKPAAKTTTQPTAPTSTAAKNTTGETTDPATGAES